MSGPIETPDLRSLLKRLYRIALAVSAVPLVIQALMAPVSVRLPVGVLVFALMGIFSRQVCAHLVARYRMTYSKADIFNSATLFFFKNVATAFGFMALYALFVPLG